MWEGVEGGSGGQLGGLGLTSRGSVLMTIPRVEEVFCPERLSAIRDIKKLSNSVQSQMFSHIVDVLSCCCDHPKPSKQRLIGLG